MKGVGSVADTVADLILKGSSIGDAAKLIAGVCVRGGELLVAFKPAWNRASFSRFLILAVAIAVMLPELVIGLTVTDSYRFNLLWPEQFGDLFRAGQFYPRWLPLSWNGLGSPNFYFYPPLFFWVTSSFDALSGGSLAPERFVPLGSLAFVIASGFTMNAWLKAHVSGGRALAGACAYMAAPYHLYDIYGRGALAEAAAYASVPLVMLALARLGEGRVRYVPLVSLGFAALLVSHLPSVLLVSLFLILPYTVFVARRCEDPLRFVVRAGLGGVLGIALSAIYLIPALALLPFVSAHALSASFYQPENWFFWHIRAGAMGARMLLIIPLALAAGLFALGSLADNWKTKGDPQLAFWAGLTLFIVVLIAGLVPPIWKIPGLALVQFPWRALLIAEFTSITMLSMRFPALGKPLGVAASFLLAFSYFVLAFMAGHTIARTWEGQKITARQIRSHHIDAPEYLPAGTRMAQGQTADDVEIDLPKLAAATASLPAARIKVSDAADGGMNLDVTSPAPTVLLLPRFYFPHWQVHDGAGHAIPVRPDPKRRVVTFDAPAGRSSFRLSLGPAPFETSARILSLMAALMLLVTIAWALGSASQAARKTARPD